MDQKRISITLTAVEFAKNDEQMKAVFDNIRNFIVCSAMIFSGIFIIQHPGISTYLNTVSGAILIATALMLMMANILNGCFKLFKTHLHPAWITIIGTVYTIISIDMVTILYSARLIK